MRRCVQAFPWMAAVSLVLLAAAPVGGVPVDAALTPGGCEPGRECPPRDNRGPGGAPAALAGCEDLPAAVRRGEGVTRVDDAGPDGDAHAWHVVAGRSRWLVFLEGGDRCAVYPVGRAAARAQGRFWPAAAGAVKAFALLPPDCSKESCEPALALRERSGEQRVLAATRLPLACDAGPTLTALRVFDDGESLQVECRGDAGAAAWNHAGALVHARGGQLAVVFEGSLGFSSESSPSEDEESGEHCAFGPDASLRVVARGRAPRLEHLDPQPRGDVPGDEERRMGTLSTWEWDAGEGRFRQTGARPAPFTPRERCTPLK
jgi:hypothetical protein